jgi:phospholipid transport system substrate-binding protein
MLNRDKILAIAVIFWFLFPATLFAGLPTDQVRATADQVLEILNNPKLASASAKQERRKRLRDAIYPRFDFAEMARRSLGPAWRQASPADQQEFIRLFTQLLEQTYVTSIEAYKGEKISYGNEIREDDDYAEVDTKVFPKDAEPVNVDYKLHKVNGEWKAYDVIIANVSIVNNYRAQFSRVLAQNSFGELLNRIRAKLAESH